MTHRTEVKLVALTDEDGLMLRDISRRLEHLQYALGTKGAGEQSEFLMRLARKVERALTVHDYYDKYAQDD